MLDCRADAADQFIYLKNFAGYSQAGFSFMLLKLLKEFEQQFFF